MTVGIYKIININNSKVYIGSSKNIEKRWKEHTYRLKYNAHHSSKLQRSYNRTENKSIFKFEIIEETSEEQLKEREQYYIDLYDSFNNGYNCCAEADNPSYTLSNLKKKSKKKLLDLYHDEFMTLYGQYQDSLDIGWVFTERLSEKHYQYGIYKTVIEIIKWFIDNYDPDKYKCRFSFNGNRQYFILVGDLDGNEFACYKRYKGKMYNSQRDTEMYQKYIEDKYDSVKHYVVNVPNYKFK
jgi:group I intron endonuclease